jgi:hypothetical protein
LDRRKQKEVDAKSLAMKMEEGAISQGMQVLQLQKLGKAMGWIFLLSIPKEHGPADT